MLGDGFGRQSWPRCILPVIDGVVPHRLGWETSGGVEISNQFWLRLELVHVADRFFWWWAVREKFGGGSFDQHCVGVVVADNGDKRDAPQVVCSRFTPATYDSGAGDGDDGVLLVVDVNLVVCEDGGIFRVGELGCVEEVSLSDAGSDVDILRWLLEFGCQLADCAGLFGDAIG